MKRCQVKGIKLNPVKFNYRLPEGRYVGHKTSFEGLKSYPSKVAAICKMDKPKCKADVQRLLGMVNYLARNLPGLSDLCRPLRQLIHKDNEWF